MISEMAQSAEQRLLFDVVLAECFVLCCACTMNDCWTGLVGLSLGWSFLFSFAGNLALLIKKFIVT